MSSMNVESWKAMYNHEEIYEVMQVNYEVTERLIRLNGNLEKLKSAVEAYLKADGCLNAGDIHAVLDAIDKDMK